MKIGLFGGAFNPVHNGHISIARAAIKEGGIDKLILIPSGNAPHKKEGSVSREDRLRMLQLAFSGEENIEISEYEFNRKEISYSADTVEYFKSIYPDDELFFLIGDDSYNNLHLWHEPNRIMKVATLLVFPREGASVLPPAVKIPMEKVKVSSSEIRERIKNGKDLTNLLPKGVFDYIMEKRLYLTGDNCFDRK